MSGTQTKVADLSYPYDTLNWRRGVHLESGTTAGKADLRFADTRTLAASATEDLDLAGVLTDAFGTALTFVRVKGIFISAATANSNNVVIGAAASNQWATLLNATGTITLRPGMTFAAMAGSADATGMAVTAGTGDLLKIANSGAGTSVTYDIVIIGASA
ncbi:hypothetical protein [Streptomyces sp. NPDC051079]|uniref:hypothetical protein n=1 Tax=Streptomyces sp. NPDC051079 TaxID=3155043 RepID=UPI00344C0BAC